MYVHVYILYSACLFTYNYHYICTCTDPSIQLQTFQLYLKQLEETVTMENTFVHSFLPHINSLLHSAVLTCKAASSSNSMVPSTEFQGENIAPNKIWNISGDLNKLGKHLEEKKGMYYG